MISRLPTIPHPNATPTTGPHISQDPAKQHRTRTQSQQPLTYYSTRPKTTPHRPHTGQPAKANFPDRARPLTPPPTWEITSRPHQHPTRLTPARSVLTAKTLHIPEPTPHTHPPQPTKHQHNPPLTPHQRRYRSHGDRAGASAVRETAVRVITSRPSDLAVLRG
ncbi:hypothetical protein JOF55_003227 [Haloactinomyces albus]|uniref:Uncharacterized protein n=1 Tax=Haloactinomyces albus TaxID=1352928 RepID=A0AAE3ZFQ6_9ACTN|nr:hypothetical protein [Haloactinomyces albus]